MENDKFIKKNYKKIERRDRPPEQREHYRLPWIDVLRGLTVISMICYHWMWDVVYIQNDPRFPWFDSIIGYIWQQSICWSFILLSGFCLRLGRHPVRRGLIVFAAGAAITVVTVFVLPRYFVSGVDIWFGVLTLLGSSMLIIGALNPVLKKIHPVIGIVIAAVLFFLFRNVSSGYLGFEGLNIMALPDALYANYITAFFGFPPAGFYSVDYFPLLPWFFLFLLGYYLFGIFERMEREREFKKTVPVIGWIGRGSLYIYIVHQPIISMVLFAIYGAL